MKLSEDKVKALRNYQDSSRCADLLMLHSMRTKIWMMILRYEGTTMEPIVKELFNDISEVFDQLEVFEPIQEEEE